MRYPFKPFALVAIASVPVLGGCTVTTTTRQPVYSTQPAYVYTTQPVYYTWGTTYYSTQPY